LAVYGERSVTKRALLAPAVTPGTGSSRMPLQDLTGMTTPSELHFQAAQFAS
jgi:sulfane dehydrogenase subunit SoxC